MHYSAQTEQDAEKLAIMPVATVMTSGQLEECLQPDDAE